jgi:hypothetical protein
MDWASSRADPVWEAMFPRRSRARVTTGALVGVEAVASWMFRPRTPEYPNPAACLA